ncbi:MAG: cob(I)yrinic acid a,c-diamide adenosyltransferase [Acidimicrobiales bacterium]
MRIYTRKGDDGTTALLFGHRTTKSSSRIELNGAIDEAQAALGLARAEAEVGSQLDEMLIDLERSLYRVMADVATEAEQRDRLPSGESAVDQPMVDALESSIDRLSALFKTPREFVIPGSNRRSATLDLARTIIRRAERIAVGGAAEGLVVPYLNRLSDLLWVMARWQEQAPLPARVRPRRDERDAQRQSGSSGKPN